MQQVPERLGLVSDCWLWLACDCGKTGSLVMQQDLEAGPLADKACELRQGWTACQAVCMRQAGLLPGLEH